MNKTIQVVLLIIISIIAITAIAYTKGEMNVDAGSLMTEEQIDTLLEDYEEVYGEEGQELPEPLEVKEKDTSIKGYLGLENCYITRGEDTHIIKGYGSMYATDIGCGGINYDVKAPDNRIADMYQITKVGYDQYLGYYLELSYQLSGQKYSFIYGHTKTIYQSGDYITPGTVIGAVSKNGKSDGPHLHIELWRGDINLSMDGLRDNPNSARLIEQRKTTTKVASFGSNSIVGAKGYEPWDLIYIKNQIKQTECKNGFTLTAYRDHSQFSIGCGTYSPVQQEGYTITSEQAEDLFQKAVDKRYNLLKSQLNEYNNNQRASLLSMYFNCPKCYAGLMRDGISEHNRKRYRMASGKVMKGLVTRRALEWNLYVK